MIWHEANERGELDTAGVQLRRDAAAQGNLQTKSSNDVSNAGGSQANGTIGALSNTVTSEGTLDDTVGLSEGALADTVGKCSEAHLPG